MPEDTGGQPALRALAQAKGLRIGAAVSARPLRDDPVYRDIVARALQVDLNQAHDVSLIIHDQDPLCHLAQLPPSA